MVTKVDGMGNLICGNVYFYESVKRFGCKSEIVKEDVVFFLLVSL